MFRAFAACTLLLAALSGCQNRQKAAESLDEIAREFVLLSLTIGEKEPGYIDAYYGPSELQSKANADAPKASLDALAQQTDALLARAQSAEKGTSGLDARRARNVVSQLTAAATRLKMLRGEKLSFADEAQGLFGAHPDIRPLASYDPVLARIETLVRGAGPLADRVEKFSDRFTIPKDRLKPVFDAAISECRRRTLQYMQLPKNERFDLAFVNGKTWSGYNYYQGDAHSRIEVNTDLPIRIDRALDLGCHEGYPGHHAFNTLLEQNLAKARNWVEFSVYPLYSPQSLIAEGTANYGIDLAFPGREKLAYETRVLYPLARLSTADAGKYSALREAMKDLAGARFTIVEQFLDGKIGEEEALRLTQKYGVQSRERAQKSIDFAKQYRSYVINYGLGEEMARKTVEAAGAAPDARWARLRQILSEPTLPSDLKR
jgi:hypothetical protein